MKKSGISKRKKIIMGSIGLAVVLLAGALFALNNKFHIFADVNTETGPGFYGMKVESVTGDSNKTTVTTTGATYVITGTGIEMSRRIDPKTNTVNPRKVAQITFDKNIGPLKTTLSNDKETIIDSSLATIDINSDSFFFITAKGPFIYTHKNLIANAPWNQHGTLYEIDLKCTDGGKKASECMIGKDDFLNRMWTDGYGGSLLAKISGSPTATAHDTDYTTVQMNSGDEMSHMVYPPKKFDFEKLYGQNSRPIVDFIFPSSQGPNTPTNPNTDSNDFVRVFNNFQKYKDEGVGTFVVWSQIYDCGFTDPLDRRSECAIPVQLDSSAGTMGYKMKLAYVEPLKAFITAAHAAGFKVLSYSYPQEPIQWKNSVKNEYQDINTTLGLMKKFQSDYGLDGWYLDGGAAAGLNLMDRYKFIKQLRQDVGDNGIIYSHDSIDPWDNDETRGIVYPWQYTTWKYNGLKAVMLDDYANYTLVGETGAMAAINNVNDLYMRFLSSGYGMSQAFGANKAVSNGKASISQSEMERLLGQNINGIARTSSSSLLVGSDWLNKFKPAYDKKKAEYQSGVFNLDVSWPMNTTTGWFRDPQNIRVSYNGVDKTSVSVSWSTAEVTDGKVYVADLKSKDGWWTVPSIQGVDKIKSQNHTVNVTGLTAGINYQFKIRSSNQKAGADETIWGYSGDLPSTSAEFFTLKKGFNTVSSTQRLDVQDLTAKGLTVFGFNQTGDKTWNVSHPSYRPSISEIKPGLGYYIDSPIDQTVPASIVSPGLAADDFTVIRRGFNLLSNSSDQAKKLSDLTYPTIKTGQDNTCPTSNGACFESKKLSELFDPTSKRVWRTYVIIKDGNTTDASKAFEYVEVTSANIATLTIPAHKAFWIFLFDKE